MWGNYGSFLDYLELRRRVERRLSRSSWVFLFAHIVLLSFLPLIFYGASPWARWWYPGPGWAPGPLVHGWIAHVMIGWSVLLLLHGLWTFFRSGTWGNRRNNVIEAEMRERLRNQDSYLVEDARDLFRLHGLLEDDVRRRAGPAALLTLFTIANAYLWISTQGGLYDALTWWLPAFMTLILLPFVGFNLWNRRRHERTLRDLMASDAPLPDVKHKRDIHYLSDDGEMLEIIDDEETYEKPKRTAQ
jgi:hypothetical protein